MSFMMCRQVFYNNVFTVSHTLLRLRTAKSTDYSISGDIYHRIHVIRFVKTILEEDEKEQ